MEELSIKSTSSTPEITYHPDRKVLEFHGSSYPENSVEFYKPVIKWLNDFMKSNTDPFSIKFRIEYLNTSSIRIFINIFRVLEKFHAAGKAFSVEWIYDPENETALDYISFFKERIQIPLQMIEEKQT